MNREIKFRIWDEDQKCILDWDEIFDTSDFTDAVLGKNRVLMQYTGLRDENGQEIYEGDIMQVQTSEGFGEFSYKFLEVKFDPYYGWLGFGNMKFTTYKYEVIGNVFENPELLK
jgi:hypothetical protein